MDNAIDKWAIVRFCEVPTGKRFRWNKGFWRRMRQNYAVSAYGSGLHFDTVEWVAILRKDLTNNQKVAMLNPESKIYEVID